MSGNLEQRHCERCGGLNPVWYAPSPLWNAVVGYREILSIWCPTCFGDAMHAKGIARTMRVTYDHLDAEIPWVHPVDGRTWNAETDLWNEGIR